MREYGFQKICQEIFQTMSIMMSLPFAERVMTLKIYRAAKQKTKFYGRKPIFHFSAKTWINLLFAAYYLTPSVAYLPLNCDIISKDLFFLNFPSIFLFPFVFRAQREKKEN